MKKRKETVKRAAALRYDAETSHAPRIVAKGAGEVAEKILEAARKNNVPIREDQQLMEMLAFLDVGREIPESAYRAVAEILAFIYKMNDAYPA